MSDTIFTFSGRLGDNLCRLFVAYRYARMRGKQVDVAVDSYTAPSMLPLFRSLSWVDNAFEQEGITDYGCGGNPIDFNRHDWHDHWRNVYHLGYCQLGSTNETLMDWAVPFDWPEDVPRGNWFTERPLEMEWDGRGTVATVHTTTTRPWADANARKTIEDAGITDFVECWDTNAEGYKFSLHDVARALCLTTVLISTYSAMTVLASLVNAPCVTILQPWGIGLKQWDDSLFHGVEHYPGWQVCKEFDPEGLKAAVAKAIESRNK